MRDIIWTIIVVWLIFRLVDIFKSRSSKKSFVTNHDQNSGQQHTSTSHPKKDVKGAVQKHLNKEGEYIDFEEVK